MTHHQMRRYFVFECEVTGHQPYGVLFRAGEGIRGFVDKADIADKPISPEDWPRIGQRITCVVLGQSRDGRVRASSRPLYVTLVKSVSDPERILSDWIRIRDEGFRDSSEKEAFFASRDTAHLLKWALRERGDTAGQIRASELLAEAPERLRREVSE